MDNKLKRNKVMLGIVLSVLTYWLFAQAIVAVVPAMEQTLSVDPSAIALAVSLTSLFSGISIVLAGYLADSFGRMRITKIGLLLSLVGSLLVAFDNNTFGLIGGRVLQGISAACIMPSTIATIKDAFPVDYQKRALSYWSMGSWGGSGACALLGGLLAVSIGWRWIFIIDAILTVVAFLLLLGAPETKSQNKQKKFDYLGLIFFLITLVSFNVFLSRGASAGWLSAFSVTLMLLFVIFGVLFFIYEKKKVGDSPFIDFSLFKNKNFSLATLSNFLLNACAGYMVIANTFFQKGMHFTALNGALLSIPYLVTILIFIRVGENMIASKGYYNPMILGSLFSGLGILLVSITSISNLVFHVVIILIGYALLGIGLGIYATPSTDLAVSNVPKDQLGTASGIYKMASSLGGGIGNACSLAIFAALANQGIMISSMWALLFNVVLCFIPMILIMVAKKQNQAN